VGSYPTGIVYDSDNGYVYVANLNNSVSVIDGSTNEVIATIKVSLYSGMTSLLGRAIMAYDPNDNQIFVTVDLCNCIYPIKIPIYVISGSNNTVVDEFEYTVPNPLSQQVQFLGSPASAGNLVYNPENGMLYLFTDLCAMTLSGLECYTALINPSTDKVLESVSSPCLLNQVVVDPATGNMYGVSDSEYGLVVKINTSGNIVSNSSIGDFTSPGAIAFSPNDGYLYVSALGSLESVGGAFGCCGLETPNQILEIDPSNFQILANATVSFGPSTSLYYYGITSLVLAPYSGLIYANNPDANEIDVVDPVSLSEVQNISIYGIADSMVYDALNGVIYASNAEKEVVLGGFPSTSTSVAANTVSAVYVGAPPKGDLEVESYSYPVPESELPQLNAQSTFPLGAYADIEFQVTMTVKNVGNTAVSSPTSLLVLSTSPLKDSGGQAPTISSSLVGPAFDIAPDQVATLAYSVTATWTYAQSTNQIIADLPVIDTYSGSALDGDLSALLAQNGLSWYETYANDNAAEFSQAVSLACPTVVESHMSTPPLADIDTAIYGAANAFATGAFTLAARYNIGFPQVLTTYSGLTDPLTGLPSDGAYVTVLMPPQKLLLVDCLMIYYLDSSSYFGTLISEISTYVGIGEDIVKYLTQPLEVGFSDFVPDWMAVADGIFKLGTESLLATAISDPGGNYTETVSPPSQPTFLAGIKNADVGQLLQDLYFYSGYLNASITSNARAYAALGNNSFQYAQLQTNNAMSYANTSSSYLQKAVSLMSDLIAQPSFSANFNESAYQKARADMSGSGLDNSTLALLQDFGLSNSINSTELFEQPSFMPINTTLLQSVPDIPASLNLFDSIQLSYVQAVQASQSPVSSGTRTTSSSSPAPSTSTAGLSSNSSSASKGGGTLPLQLALALAILAAVVIVASYFVVRRNTLQRTDSKLGT
jgi:YVTN family beta-propeller protein